MEMAARSESSLCQRIAWPFLVALLTLLASAGTRDPGRSIPPLPPGPGLTLDEVYNVEMGVYLVQSLRLYGVGILSPESIKEVFGSREYNPDHPPLGRLALGGAESWGRWWHGRGPRDWYVTADARVASSLAFALTIWIVGSATGLWFGRAAGVFAAAALPLTPRLFGHSHLAALESFVGLAYAAVILFVAEVWSRPLLAPPGGPPRIRFRDAFLAGLLLGLALLTKIQGVLACVPIGLWGLWHFRQRAIVPGIVLGATAFGLFFLGWPWLWLDPVRHTLRYFASSTDRQVLYCYYEATKFADHDVPWHYPFVIFAATVPLGLHLLALLGLFGKPAAAATSTPAPIAPIAGSPAAAIDLGLRRNPRLQLVLLAVVFPLVLFAMPGIAVYDGERLFLISYPLWGVFVGRGAAILWRRVFAGNTRPPLAASSTAARPHGRWGLASLLVGGLFACQAIGHWSMWPFLLSHYNLVVGGLRGANRLGFERSYWGESLNRTFFEEVVRQVPAQTTLHVAPVLHPLQLPDLAAQIPMLKEHGLQLAAYDDRIRDQVRFVIVHRRMADPWATLDEDKAEANGFRLLTEIRREGVQLAALYENIR